MPKKHNPSPAEGKKSGDGIEKMQEIIKEPKSKFIKVRCPKCKNEQIIFGKATSVVNCLVCSKVLSEPTGGKGKIKARILEVLE